jgi:hypothetical protein
MFLTHFHRALDFESGEERIAVLIWRPEALWLQSHITKLREGAELASEEQEEEVGPSAITTSLQRGNTLKSRSRKKIETSASSKKLCLNAKGEAIQPSGGNCCSRILWCEVAAGHHFDPAVSFPLDECEDGKTSNDFDDLLDLIPSSTVLTSNEANEREEEVAAELETQLPQQTRRRNPVHWHQDNQVTLAASSQSVNVDDSHAGCGSTPVTSVERRTSKVHPVEVRSVSSSVTSTTTTTAFQNAVRHAQGNDEAVLITLKRALLAVTLCVLALSIVTTSVSKQVVDKSVDYAAKLFDSGTLSTVSMVRISFPDWCLQ